jgi:HK97 family phage portal protein
MTWYDRFLGSRQPQQKVEPSFSGNLRATSMSGPEFFDDLTDPRLGEYLRGAVHAASGVGIDEHSAMRIAVANRCVNLISGIMATLPTDLMIREDEQKRSPAVGNPLRDVLTVKPNRWQTPGEFKRMLQAHKLLRGNGYAYKVKSRGAIRELIPLIPSRMAVVQNDDLSITYKYNSRNGNQAEFSQEEIFHLRGLSWDGVTGLSVISYAREAMGLALTTERAGANLFRNGQFTSGFLKTPGKLSDPAYERLKSDVNDSKGVTADTAGGIKILEEGLSFEASSLSAKDAEFLATRGFQRTDVGMFFGVPPHLYGDVGSSTSWGTGIQQQNIGFLQYCIQDHITAWKETYKRDCLSEKGMDDRLYVHVDLNGFLQADSAAQSEYFSKALGSGGAPPWMTQNEVRSKVDLPPRSEAWADQLPQHGIALVRDTNVAPPGAPAPPPK